MPAKCTQCKVLYVNNYPNPSFGPFAEACCFIVGGFELLMHSGYGMFELLSIFSPICTHFQPLAIWAELRRLNTTTLIKDPRNLRQCEMDTRVGVSPNSYTNHARAFTLYQVL